jgi:biopolymer transport protein ExbD
MGKLKIKKNDVWIDMTPMSDVMVLLLTFFMLSANFTKNEAIKVVTPSSTTMSKVPATPTLDITIDSIGRVFLSTDKKATLKNALTEMMNEREVQVDTAAFFEQSQIGVPMKKMPAFLALSREDQMEFLFNNKTDILELLDSIQARPDKMSEFQLWVKSLKKGYRKWLDSSEVPEDLKATAPTKLEICIKASKDTPYSSVKKVINELQDINESRYKLVTQYKKEQD